MLRLLMFGLSFVIAKISSKAMINTQAEFGSMPYLPQAEQNLSSQAFLISFFVYLIHS